MTDDTTSGQPRGAGGDPPRSAAEWSRSDPMAVPTTSPLWTYEQRVEPPAAGFDPAPEMLVDPEAEVPARGRRGPALGLVALFLAIGAAAVEAAGIGASVNGDFAAGTVLAFVAIGASVAAFAVGIVAVVLRAGRAVAITGAVLGIVVNPIVLIWVLGVFAGAASLD